jgi:hypothetical protein
MATTIAFPTTVSEQANLPLGVAWTNPNNIKADDGANATCSPSLAGSTWLIGRDFHLLTEEVPALGGAGSGPKIPPGANILGIRFYFEGSTSTSDPCDSYGDDGVTQNTPVTWSGAMAVRTIGHGTLSAGSTLANGNAWSGNDLSTPAGQQAARDELKDFDGTSGLRLMTGGHAAALAYNVAVDYYKVEVHWAKYETRNAVVAESEGIEPELFKQVSSTSVQPVAESELASGEPKALVTELVFAQGQGELLSGVHSTLHSKGAPPLSQAELLVQLLLHHLVNKAAVLAEGELLVPRAQDAQAFQFSFAGVTRDQNGTPVPSAPVDLFRSDTRTLVATGWSNAAGTYAFNLTSAPIQYFARAEITTIPTHIFGTTDSNLTVDPIQIYP